MGSDTLTGKNMVFPIYNEDGTSFHGLVLRKSTFDSVVMSLNQKITGDVFYTSNSLNVTMREYIVYNGVKYTLVNPPTITRNGLVPDNSDLKGMTKYSFEFYHPMCQLSNMPFNDVAVSFDEKRYLSEDKTFAWIGYPADFRDKLNKNLENTLWICELSESITQDKLNELSSVISFDKNTIADALKAWYDTWKLPFIIDEISEGESGWSLGKSFKIILGYPSNEIYSYYHGHSTEIPYVFRMGKGVGLKNNSRTPRNNKIVTRIAGYGSEDNIPYGYPQIVWTGDQSWDYTINNSSAIPNSYPIYDGIVNGEYVRLIKHPFTRTHLMPTIYTDGVDKKVNPFNDEYNPNIELIDYYDADNDDYENRININAPSYEIHEFEGLKPELGEAELLDAWPIDTKDAKTDIVMYDTFMQGLRDKALRTTIDIERQLLNELYNQIQAGNDWNATGEDESIYRYDIVLSHDSQYFYVSYDSNNICFNATVQRNESITPEWIDDIDGDGKYKQSYFKAKLPILDFDIYACAAITQNMQINMRGGACLGCTFDVQVDWDAYKKNFYDNDGKFDPDGEKRDKTMFPDSREEEIVVILKKETETFGVLMPNRYQNVKAGDAFVILGISLPLSYIRDAEERLDEEMKSYMLLNNIYYFDYPLKFDEAFLFNNTEILRQVRTNSTVRFMFAGIELSLFVKQITVKFGDSPLPQYDITLTDNIEVSTSPLGQVSDAVDRIAALIAQTRRGSGSGAGSGSGGGSGGDASEKLSRLYDDEAHGLIGFIKGAWFGTRQWFIDKFGNANFNDTTVNGLLKAYNAMINNVRSTNYSGDGIMDSGWRITNEYEGSNSKATFDFLYIRKKAIFEELEIRKLSHIGGNFCLSGASGRAWKVDYYDADGNLLGYETYTVPWTLASRLMILFSPHNENNRYLGRIRRIQRRLTDAEKLLVRTVRVYMYNDDGTTETMNNWTVGAQARCQTFNVEKQMEFDGSSWKGTKVGNTYWYRLVTAVSTEPVRLEDGQLHHWIEFSVDMSQEGHAYAWADALSDLPSRGDVFVQLGHRTRQDQSNVIMLETANEDSPAIKMYAGVNWWTYGSDKLVAIMSPNGWRVVSNKFEWITQYGERFQTTVNRGVWVEIPVDDQGDRKCYYNDMVSHNGAYWRCIVGQDTYTTDEPSETSSAWSKEVYAALAPYVKLSEALVAVPCEADSSSSSAFSKTIVPKLMVTNLECTITSITLDTADSHVYLSGGNIVVSFAAGASVTNKDYTVTLEGDLDGNHYTATDNLSVYAIVRGNDAYEVTAQPNTMIFTQQKEDPYSINLDGSETGNSSTQISVTMDGVAQPFRITNVVCTGRDGSGDPVGGITATYSNTSGRAWITHIPNNVEKGEMAVTISYGSGAQQTLILQFYCNLIGTWQEQVVGDTKTEIATKTLFEVCDETGKVIGTTTLANYTKSSSQQAATLTKTTTSQGQQITATNERISTAERNISTLSTEINTVDGKFVNYSTTSQTSDMISNAVFGLASESYVNQTASSVEIGVKQYADGKDSTLRREISKTGIVLDGDNSKINLYGNKVYFFNASGGEANIKFSTSGEDSGSYIFSGILWGHGGARIDGGDIILNASNSNGDATINASRNISLDAGVDIAIGRANHTRNISLNCTGKVSVNQEAEFGSNLTVTGTTKLNGSSYYKVNNSELPIGTRYMRQLSGTAQSYDDVIMATGNITLPSVSGNKHITVVNGLNDSIRIYGNGINGVSGNKYINVDRHEIVECYYYEYGSSWVIAYAQRSEPH